MEIELELELFLVEILEKIALEFVLLEEIDVFTVKDTLKFWIAS